MNQEERDRLVAQRLEREARRWAAIERFSVSTLRRFRASVENGASGRELVQVERELIGVLNRAIEIRETTP